MAAANAELTTKRRKPLAVLNGHIYSQHKPTKDGESMLWRCVFQNSGEHKGCRGRRRKHILAFDRQAVEQVHIPTRHLVAQAYQDISAAAAEDLPESPSLSRRIQRKRAPQNGAQIDCHPDFERASLNVFQALFPQARMQHCYFHFHQLLFRNLQAKGLSVLYREVLPVRVLLRCLAALAFLPPDEVPDALEEVVQALNDKINDGTIPQQYHGDLWDYLEYFQKLFVYRLVAGRLQPPAYPPATWSCYAAVVNDLPGTNNAMESWHRAFNGYFNRAHVRLSLFLAYLRMEETSIRRRVRRGQLNGVQLQARDRRAQFAARDKSEVLRYRDAQPGQRHRIHFLKSIQKLLCKANFIENAGAAGGVQ